MELGRTDEAIAAVRSALTDVDKLLALAESNVKASQARSLALAGMAATGIDPARVEEARAGLYRIRAVTSAGGVAAETQQLLDIVARHDASDVLNGIHVVEGD